MDKQEFHEVTDESTPRPSTSNKHTPHTESNGEESRSSPTPATDTGQVDGAGDKTMENAEEHDSQKERETQIEATAKKLESSLSSKTNAEGYDEDPEQVGTSTSCP